MLVLGKSASYLKKRDVESLIKSKCPLRVFKNINLTCEDNRLKFSFRLPSKTRLDLVSDIDVPTQFIDYLIDSELSIDKLHEQKWCTDCVSNLQLQMTKDIKDYCSSLDQEHAQRYDKRIRELQNDLTTLCVCKASPALCRDWLEAIRKPLFKSMKAHEL